ncbi:fructokinase [Pelagirhabdus alkalitolerans]|uniref:Fructokinase n=1 Tax=Pelagirhabdus alkalitolerans TaxID=1612202 RepID=A0A1G6KD35_9BACI|nr:carbohydrate kinase [Pelagirhabdus alkalitolerans]SDC28226.1 fructokinase [Pelagirhabdus alkalitolerans]
MQSKLYAIGEALIDFIPNVTNTSLKDVESFKKVMGGAPANVAVAVSKLGGDCSFVSKLGNDAFGDHITERLIEHQVDTTYLEKTDEANTGLAFVSLRADGERDFSFYRKPSADMLLTREEVDKIKFESTDILHFGSVDLIDAPIKGAHELLIERAHEAGAVVSFDPNVRLPLWDSEEECQTTIQSFIPKANVLKISDEELEFITGIKDETKALDSLFVGAVHTVIYTMGKEGARILTKNGLKASHHGFSVKAIDTTGAGDAFVGATLYQLQKRLDNQETLDLLDEASWEDMLQFSNGYAALTTQEHGAVDALPTLKEARMFIQK